MRAEPQGSAFSLGPERPLALYLQFTPDLWVPCEITEEGILVASADGDNCNLFSPVWLLPWNT